MYMCIKYINLIYIIKMDRRGNQYKGKTRLEKVK